MAAHRELKEELGIEYDFGNIRPHLTINFKHGFDDFYLIKLDGVDINSLSLQAEEVQAVKWASKDEVSAMFETGEFVPYIKSFILSLFDLNQMYGIVIN